jgi:chromosome partitioning protein
MKTWAVITQKGGSGKTTIALHLGIVAESHGLRTVIIDIDPQRSALKWNMIRKGSRPTVVGSIAPDLGKVLSRYENSHYDLAIVDTSPRADRDSIEVSRRADLIIVPVRPSILDLPAVEDTLKLIKASGRLNKTVIVLNSVSASTNEARDAASVLAGLGPLSPVSIGERIDFRRALTAGRGVTEFAPNSRAAHEVEALFLALAQASPI